MRTPDSDPLPARQGLSDRDAGTPDRAAPDRARYSEDRSTRDRIVGGDREAADELIRRHLDSLYEFVFYRVGRNSALAEDVVQDTMLVAFERLIDFDGRSSLHTWMCGIAKNKIRTRRRERRPVRVEDLLDDADPEIDALLSQIEREPLPDAVLEARETAELVGATLSSLPPDYRQALVGKYVDGKTVPDMARAEGRHVKAAESLLFRARKAFADVFGLLAKRRGGEV